MSYRDFIRALELKKNELAPLPTLPVAGADGAARPAGLPPMPPSEPDSDGDDPKPKKKGKKAVIKLTPSELQTLLENIQREIQELVGQQKGKGQLPLKKVFKQFDSNGKGVLTQTKFRKALETLGFKLDINVFRQIFTLFDDDGNDRVDFNEVPTLVLQGSHPRSPTQHYQRWYSMYYSLPALPYAPTRVHHTTHTDDHCGWCHAVRRIHREGRPVRIRQGHQSRHQEESGREQDIAWIYSSIAY